MKYIQNSNISENVWTKTTASCSNQIYGGIFQLLTAILINM